MRRAWEERKGKIEKRKLKLRIPQRLKPLVGCDGYGTAEAPPFPSPIYRMALP